MSKLGIENIGESQLVGYPTQYPEREHGELGDRANRTRVSVCWSCSRITLAPAIRWSLPRLPARMSPPRPIAPPPDGNCS